MCPHLTIEIESLCKQREENVIYLQSFCVTFHVIQIPDDTTACLERFLPETSVPLTDWALVETRLRPPKNAANSGVVHSLVVWKQARPTAGLLAFLHTHVLGWLDSYITTGLPTGERLFHWWSACLELSWVLVTMETQMQVSMCEGFSLINETGRS